MESLRVLGLYEVLLSMLRPSCFHWNVQVFDEFTWVASLLMIIASSGPPYMLILMCVTFLFLVLNGGF